MSNPKIDNFVSASIADTVLYVALWPGESHCPSTANSKTRPHFLFPQFAGLDFFSMQHQFQEIQTAFDVLKTWFSVEFLDSVDMKTCVTLWNQYQRIQLLQLWVYFQHLLHDAVLVGVTICKCNLDENKH